MHPMKLDAKSILVPTGILFLICVAVAAALAGANFLTAERIEEQQRLKAEESRKIVLAAAESFEEQEGYYKGVTGGQTVGYVFETEAKGYGGSVRVMTGIGQEGDITGVVILSHGETPGLGANAVKEEFRDQFRQAAPENGLKVVKFQTPGEGEVEALTGATITTRAVSEAVNAAISQYYEVREES